MREAATGLAALVMYVTTIVLLSLIEHPVRNLIGWHFSDPAADMNWWRVGEGLTMAACTYWLVMRRHSNAAVKRRRTLAERARA